jgi:GR25 family glycosyltransferase involved in LPS biosynthesis
MLLINKIPHQEILNYKKNIIECLIHNSSNNYINEIIVYLEASVKDLPDLKNVKYVIKRDKNIDELLEYSKKISQRKKIIIADWNIKLSDLELRNVSLNKVKECSRFKSIDRNEIIISDVRDLKIYETKNKEINNSKSTEELVKYKPKFKINQKIDVVIVSVNYNDYLVLSLMNSIKLFENIHVVTSKDDFLCHRICEKFSVNCIKTDIMYENNAKFNKGKAINLALDSLKEESFVLILDADIIVSDKIDLKELNTDTIYGTGRYFINNYEELLEYESTSNLENVLYEEFRGIGFFQLFYNTGQKYPETFDDAGWSDIVFRDGFKNKKELNNIILHLGRCNKNWQGRVTNRFLENEDFIKLLNTQSKKSKKNSIINISPRDESIIPKLAVITTFYNPQNYINIRYNYLKFSEKIKEKADLFPIELSFDGNFFIEDDNVIQIKGDKKNILWQKEVLLNIALEKIPKEYTNIAWIDCDILFENENWIEECNWKLNDYKVVQLYEWAKRLGPNSEIEMTSRGIISRIHEIDKVDINLSRAIPGFAWAIRREVIDEIKFLETQIIGGADSLMFYSFFGIKRGFQSEKMNEKWFEKFSKWSDKASQVVANSVGFVSGSLTHLYHGSKINRGYNERYNILNQNEFDPSKHLSKDRNGLWKLKNRKISIELEKYFEDRNEDDNIIDINSYFDKIFVLNLERRPDRLVKVSEKLNQIGIEFEIFKAIDGNDLEFDNSNFVQGKGLIENKYALACLRSHKSIIALAKERGYKKILILEDDVLLANNFNIHFQKLRNLKDWKLIYLGGSQYNWKLDHIEDFYLSKNTLGTFAYSIDESIYDEVIELFNNEDKSVDNILSDIQQKNYGECFTFYPNICKADVSESEIRGCRDNAEHSKKMRWDLINYV